MNIYVSTIHLYQMFVFDIISLFLRNESTMYIAEVYS